jgi:hypothetical protein
MYKRYIPFLACLVLLVVTYSSSTWAYARTFQQTTQIYQPPSTILVKMYELTSDGSLPEDPAEWRECSIDSSAFGCTDYIGSSIFPYPYSTNPVRINIEADYLPNVITGEAKPTEVARFGVFAQLDARRGALLRHDFNHRAPTATPTRHADANIGAARES